MERIIRFTTAANFGSLSLSLSPSLTFVTLISRVTKAINRRIKDCHGWLANHSFLLRSSGESTKVAELGGSLLTHSGENRTLISKRFGGGSNSVHSFGHLLKAKFFFKNLILRHRQYHLNFWCLNKKCR